MKFKVIGYSGNGYYIVEGIDLTESEKEKYGTIGRSKIDVFADGSFDKLLEKEKNITQYKIYKKYFEGRTIEVESFYPYALLANNVKIIDDGGK